MVLRSTKNMKIMWAHGLVYFHTHLLNIQKPESTWMLFELGNHHFHKQPELSFIILGAQMWTFWWLKTEWSPIASWWGFLWGHLEGVPPLACPQVGVSKTVMQGIWGTKFPVMHF